MLSSLIDLSSGTGIALLFEGNNWKHIVMIAASIVLMYLAIVKKYEPLLLLPIAAGILLANLPGSGITDPEAGNLVGGFLYYLSKGMVLFPPLIFLGVGAMTDFGPVIANPKTFLFGGAAQVGIFAAFIGAVALGFAPKTAACIGIIGSADGPTTIYLSSTLAPEILGTITIAAYSYMALIPIIQPPIMRALTTKAERAVKMEQLRYVSRTEKMRFSVTAIIITALLIPQSLTLIGMLMIGNLFKESGVVDKLAKASSEYLMYVLIVFIGICVGSKTKADTFLTFETIGILVLGLAAFALSTISGVLFGKLMCKATRGKINPLIGAAGVSAMPMAARVVQKVAKEENPDNFLLMHAMGPTVASTIGSAVVAGVFISLFP